MYAMPKSFNMQNPKPSSIQTGYERKVFGPISRGLGQWVAWAGKATPNVKKLAYVYAQEGIYYLSAWNAEPPLLVDQPAGAMCPPSSGPQREALTRA